MKKIMSICALSMAAFVFNTAHAAEIRGGRYVAENEAIELDVSYGGGCQEHTFKLQPGICLESFPVQCQMQLLEDSNDDLCEAYVHKTITISLREAGLDDGYYNGARLTIEGDRDTKVSIQLPLRD